MSPNRQYICQVVGAALFGTELLTSPVSDWKEIYQEFADQAILAIPAPILEKLSMPQELKKQWESEVMMGSARSIRLMANQNELIRQLMKNGIPYVILKGVAASKYYPMPWLRTMGDVDFIVQPVDFERTKQLMLEKGFIPLNEDHEDTRHVTFSYCNVYYELHRFFSTTEDEYGKKLDRLVCLGITNAVDATIMDYSFRMLPERMNGIVLLAHIHQHLKSGLGFRQMIDWFMYVKSGLHDEQWPEFKKLSDQVGLTTLAKVATRIGQMYFGLDNSIAWCRDADESVCEDLLDHVFHSGNFGKKDMDNSTAIFAMIRLRQHFFRTLQDNGERNWTLLKKHAWLKHLAWLYQLCRYVRLGLTNRNIRAKAAEDRARSRELVELMKKLEM